MFRINPNDYIKQFEKKIEPFLKDNGMVDGHLLSSMIRVWKPKLTELIEIPETEFRLSDCTEKLLKIFMPGW